MQSLMRALPHVPLNRYLTRKHVLRLVKIGLLSAVTVQAGTALGLVVFDNVKKRGRRRRAGFPQPGAYTATVGDTNLTIHTFGADLYEDMLAEIDGAKHTVLLETYLWKSDEVGQRFKDALNRAAERGVDVKVVFDGLGNMVVKPWFYRFSQAVESYRFPVVRPRILINPISESGVTHRKILVVDDTVGFVGGYNIGTLYATEWRDTHVKLEGPEVWELRESFEAVWNKVLGGNRTPVQRIPAHEAWNADIRSVDNIPLRRTYPIRSVYLESIDKADDHIFITTAYFIPDRHILEALVRASQRGVDVRILIPKDSNHILADFASRGFWRTLLDADITVLLYENAMMHAKTMTIDGRWSTIGTANIDRISLGLNYEINMEITDPDVAAHLESIFAVDATNALLLTPEEWEQRHHLARFAEWVMAPLGQFL